MNIRKKKKAKGLHIIIVGCGKVGSNLVDRLIEDEHNISVIDQDASKIQQITDRYDVFGVVGNGASFAVQMEAGVDQADVLIAVTAADELNLLCCIVAKQSGHCDVIARVRTPEYSEEAEYLKKQLGLAMIINPDLLAARAIARNLFMPTALSVNAFARGQADMVRIKLPQGNVLTGKTIRELGQEGRLNDVLICAVERDGDVMIPAGSFVLQAGDVIVFIAQIRHGRNFLKNIGFQTHQVGDALLIGSGRTGYYLAKMLLDAGVEVKIVENDPGRCEELSEILSDAVVIRGDASNADLLQEVGIESAESVVALTGFDEENILLTLHAREVSNAKTITKINRLTFHQVIENLDLGSVVFPKYITSETIVAFVRAKEASLGSEIETLVQLFGDRIEAIEFRVGAESQVTGTSLADLDLKEQVLITCINRNGRIIIPRGSDAVQSGDTVIVVTTQKGIDGIEDILAG